MRKLALWAYTKDLEKARDMIVTSTWATTTNPMQFLAATRELRKRQKNWPKEHQFVGMLAPERGNA
jgi:hypothetical protein